MSLESGVLAEASKFILPLQKETINTSILWVGPPPTNSGILGIYKDLNIITITPCGHY